MLDERLLSLAQECQVFAGNPDIVGGREPLARAVNALIARVPEPENRAELLVFAAVLNHTAAGLAKHLHHDFHSRYGGLPCDFDPAEHVAIAWAKGEVHDPRAHFARCVNLFHERFAGAHPVPPEVAAADLIDHGGRNLSPVVVARCVGCHIVRLRSQFRKRYGVTLVEYQLRARLREAARLLVTTEDKNDVVASAAGFGSRDRFYERFRNTFGVTPREYRSRAHRGGQGTFDS